MKYEFKQISTDKYALEYKSKGGEDKHLEFTRTVNIGKKMQSATMLGRMKMYSEMTKMGITKDDLVIKRDKGNGKTTYDETNFIGFEKAFVEQANIETFNEIIEKCFGMDIETLLEDMGFNAEDKKAQDEVEKFTKSFMSIMSGKDLNTPSKK